MARKPASDRVQVAERLAYLRDQMWNGNQNEMARALGLQQGTLSNVLSGKRSAGSKVLKAACSYPGVNPNWVRSGAGKPFEKPTFRVESSVPISGQLLPGTPNECHTLLTPRRAEAPKTYCRQTVYAIEATQVSRFGDLDISQFEPGDLVLIDADPVLLNGPIEFLASRLCVVQTGDLRLVLRRVSVNHNLQGGPSLQIEKLATDQSLPPNVDSTNKRERAICLGDLSTETVVPDRLQRIRQSDVRGVAVCLIREL